MKRQTAIRRWVEDRAEHESGQLARWKRISSIRRIQAWWRKVSVTHRALMERKYRAACRIQKAWRRYVVRKQGMTSLSNLVDAAQKESNRRFMLLILDECFEEAIEEGRRRDAQRAVDALLRDAAKSGASTVFESQPIQIVANQWLEYVGAHPGIATRLAQDAKARGPTWREAAAWARWLLEKHCPQIAITHEKQQQQQQHASTTGAGITSTTSGTSFFSPEASMASSFGLPMRRRAAAPQAAIEASLRILRNHVLCSLYPGMASMGAGEWRLYWMRVEKSFSGHFGDVGREYWAAAADADARASAIRHGKRTPRQFEAGRAAINAVNNELRSPLHRPRSRLPPRVYF